MNESESKNEKPEENRRFDPELLKKGLRCNRDQCDMLKRCWDKKDMTEWNEWRENNPDEEVWLQGAKLRDAFLRRAYLANAHLEEAALWYAHLEGGHFADAHLEGADLRCTHLEEATFVKAYLQKAKLTDAHLEKADLCSAHLEGARLSRTHLEGANLSSAHLEGAQLINAYLEGTNLMSAYLQDAYFLSSSVNITTLIWKPKVNRFREDGEYTDFSGVALNSVRIDPLTKQLLEYNIRHKYWMFWYKFKDWNEISPKENRSKWDRIIRQPVSWFWAISDYGLSTMRIIVTFLGLALIFANIYYHWGRIAPPGIVDNLFVDTNGIEVQLWLVPLRTLYFSIVTMTTLGFGDMYANAQSILGHLLLMIQVILGYVLLGALVTRFAVLFTAGGPAGKFADEKGEKDETE